MKKLFLLFIAVVAFSLSGCVSVEYPTKYTRLCHSDEKPFYSLIGKEAKLLRPVTISFLGLESPDSIMELGPPIKNVLTPINNILGTDHGELLSDSYYEVGDIMYDLNRPELPNKLPKGTIIKFDSFWVNKDYFFFMPYNIRYTAWFRVPSLNLPDSVRFLYVWGRGRYLHRAPWEDDKVPETRYVGFSGKGYDPK